MTTAPPPGHDALRQLVAAELATPVQAQVADMATAIAARHPGALGVLFYGSCLREASLGGLMLDFYLIVESYDRAFDAAWLATANRLLPPNVFPFQHGGLVAKYAVLSAADFDRLNRADAGSVSVWARFAQPSRLAWARDDAARDTIVDAVALAAPTLFALTLPMLEADAGLVMADIWRAGFALTYGAELRAERASRPGSVFDADPARYERFGRAALADLIGAPTPTTSAQPAGLPKTAPPITPSDAPSGSGPWDDALFDSTRSNGEGSIFPAIDADAAPSMVQIRSRSGLTSPRVAARRWRRLRRSGKLLTLARLAKASATYAGGLDYLAWKIGRHSGHALTIRPWQRRWPILGAISLLPRLILRGAIR